VSGEQHLLGLVVEPGKQLGERVARPSDAAVLQPTKGVDLKAVERVAIAAPMGELLDPIDDLLLLPSAELALAL